MTQAIKRQMISNDSIYLFKEGTNQQCYLMLGAHLDLQKGQSGTRFCVWAPNALCVSVTGNFNNWNQSSHQMRQIKDSGIWEIFIPGVGEYEVYKYAVTTMQGNILLKSDPYAFYSEVRPNNASVVYNLDGYKWNDDVWQRQKSKTSLVDKPLSIYEVHAGSWRRNADGSFLSYVDLAEQLTDYVLKTGYTHIELMPISEHPLDASWGYQVTGYYSATSRYGTPKDLMYFVDKCHQKGIGVILDWVPGHFPKDAHGLARFDGTALYEHADPRQGEHPQWGTYIFNYGRNEVKSFLVSNLMFWLEHFHIDGFRVDAVSSILYLDFAREDYIPNKYGGHENLEAVEFLKYMNDAVHEKYPNTLMIAEESGNWPMVTRPTHLGGLGFDYKWNMGWMNDILKYVSMDPLYRKWHHHLVTFSLMYVFSESYILPMSHDETVHGKKSLLDKMPGDYWQKFAGLRCFYGYMMAHPGKKLLFMGGEFGQFIEWKFDDSLDWHLLNYESHKKMVEYVTDLNHIYIGNNCLWEIDHSWDGFTWIDPNDYNQSVLSFIRKGKDSLDYLIVVVNFTPVPREQYRIGVPDSFGYKEFFSSDDGKYGGTGMTEDGLIIPEDIPWHNFNKSIVINIPPLACVYYKPVHNKDDKSGVKKENNEENDIL